MPPAGEDPHTRTALAAHQAGALRWLGGGGIAVVLGVLLGWAGTALADGGRRVPGLGLLVIALVLLGIAGVVAGTGALLRTRRWHRALAVTPWQRGRLRIAGPAVIAFEPEGFDELDPMQEPVRLQLLSTAVWRTRAVQALDGGEVRAAPVGDGQWVLTAEGLPTLYGARLTRR
ncbi:UNVERIFIED_ORG: hypothetical protein E4P37_15615 [Bacillus sp. AZ43]